MTFDDTIELLALLTNAYPNMTLNEGTPEVWHDALADLPYGETIAAVRYLINVNVFPPSIAEIRARVISRRPQLPAQVPDVDPDDVGAYLQALRAQRTINAPRAIGDAR